MTDSGTLRRLPALGAGLGSLLIALAACSPAATTSATPSAAASVASEEASASPSEAAASGPTITIANSTSFGESEITVPAGQTLTVENASGAAHTFTEGTDGQEAADARVNEEIAADATVQVTFPEPGDYNVTCLFHASMNMVVHVE